MKKTLALLIFLVIILSGCNYKNSGNSSQFISSSNSSLNTSSSVESAASISSNISIGTGIKGSNITDVKTGLEKFGFSNPLPKKSTENDNEYIYQTINSDTNATYSYFAVTIGLSEIKSISFTLVSSDVSKNLDVSYIKWAASIPYDSATPSTAQTWVSNNINNLETGKPITKIFGDALFELSGNKYAKSLLIKKNT